MDVSKMKNMVVLRNLPSNIVDEAFVVIKSNKKAKKLEKIEKLKNQNTEGENKKDKEYVLKEAEMLISDYIFEIENKEKTNTKKIPNKFKTWAIISTAIAISEGICIFCF